jgi:hypothetical protein
VKYILLKKQILNFKIKKIVIIKKHMFFNYNYFFYFRLYIGSNLNLKFLLKKILVIGIPLVFLDKKRRNIFKRFFNRYKYGNIFSFNLEKIRNITKIKTKIYKSKYIYFKLFPYLKKELENMVGKKKFFFPILFSSPLEKNKFIIKGERTIRIFHLIVEYDFSIFKKKNISLKFLKKNMTPLNSYWNFCKSP